MPSHFDTDVTLSSLLHRCHYHPPADSSDQAVFCLLIQPFPLNRSLTYISTIHQVEGESAAAGNVGSAAVSSLLTWVWRMRY